MAPVALVASRMEEKHQEQQYHSSNNSIRKVDRTVVVMTAPPPSSAAATTTTGGSSSTTSCDNNNCDNCDRGDVGIPLLELASREIENMRNKKKNGESEFFRSFPPACLSLLKELDGNHRCMDCGNQTSPQWGACRYGILLCLQCSGIHRSLGVQVSYVRSLTMDEWSVSEVVSMLEGGNQQLSSFFDRHELTYQHYYQKEEKEKSGGAVVVTNNKSSTSTTNNTNNTNNIINKENVTRLRYKTKAALFYRRQMEIHVENILNAGPYRGREISRRLKHHPLEKRNTTIE